MPSKRTPAAQIALGGMLAAMAVAVMSLGTLIPVATYVCPMVCMLLLQVILKTCGTRIGWGWYGAVAILGLLLAPDKEAAGVFLAIGYYPILKPRLDRLKGKWLWKALLFNAAILSLYWLLIHLMGLEQLGEEFAGMGLAMTAVLLLLGNVTFFLLDRLLGMGIRKKRKKHMP